MSIDPEAFQPLPLRDERVEALHAEAAAVLGRAKAEAVQIRSEAKAIRDAANAEQAERRRRDDKVDAWAARAIIAGTVGLTASGEYALARMVGFDPEVAWLLPFVIDVYVIQAFRRHRDIVQAISLTVAANVTYHLADKGLFGVEAVRDRHEPQWWLIAMVASVASLILWRVHLMTAPPKPVRERRERRQENRAPSTTPAPVEPTTTGPVEAPGADKSADKSAANNDRQKPTTGAAKTRQEAPAKKGAPVDKKPTSRARQNADRKSAKKGAPTRRSMDEWVALTEPIFHAEFQRLRRNPTASEFANAIADAGHGRPSDSTAKNIRTEILDRAELPSLDGTE